MDGHLIGWGRRAHRSQEDKTQGGGLTAPQKGRRGHSQKLRQSGLGIPWVGVAKSGKRGVKLV